MTTVRAKDFRSLISEARRGHPKVGSFDLVRITRSMEEFGENSGEFGPASIWNYAYRALPNVNRF